MLTGRYQQRFGHEFNPGPAARASQKFGLPLEETTIAERLKSLGYVTGMFGKWHLGYRDELTPLKRGFDEFFGFHGGAHSYVNATDRAANPIWRGTERVAGISYTTDEFARETVAFIERHQQKPFFIYLPFNAVHAPLDALEKYRARFPSISDAKRRTYAAMLSAMDDGVGRVLARLRELRLEENTLVFFISDNGGPTYQTTSRNDPLRGVKGQLLEGGVRVPFLVQWKGKIPAGKVYDAPVSALDLHPTALLTAGGKLPTTNKLDGVDLLPYLTGKQKGRPHEQLFWRYGEGFAIRAGDWKLVKDRRDEKVRLYNLAQDSGEKNDLSEQQPAKFKELQLRWERWNAELIKPRWVRGGDGD
jgi:arylsulfatase A-like enzyme